MSGNPAALHLWPAAEASSGDEENLPSAQTSRNRNSESPGIHCAATVGTKLEPSPTKSTSPKSDSQMTGVQHDDVRRQLDQVDSFTFAPSQKVLRSGSSQGSSPRSAVGEDFTGARGSPSAVSLLSETNQPLPSTSPHNDSSCLSDSTTTTLPVKSLGRGKKLLEMLNRPKESVEVGTPLASHPLPESTAAESQRSGELRTVSHSGKEPRSMKQSPKEVVLSAGLDKDLDSHVPPLMQSYQEKGQQVVTQVVDNKLISPKSSMSKTSASSAETKPKSPAQSSVLSPRDNASPTEQTIRMTPAAQAPLTEHVGRGHTPQSCESPRPLERSLGSSTDVSLCSYGLDQSSSSKMLTKRLPKVASRSGSVNKSLPGRLSCSPSLDSSTPAVHSAGPRTGSAHSRKEHYDVIPEAQREPVTTVPANDRYFA